MGKSLLFLFALVMVGCAEQPEPLAAPPKEPQATEASVPSGGGDGVGIVSPAAGSISPVTGGGGGGGGNSAGNVLKSKAIETAEEQGKEAVGGEENGADNGT